MLPPLNCTEAKKPFNFKPCICPMNAALTGVVSGKCHLGEDALPRPLNLDSSPSGSTGLPQLMRLDVLSS